MEGARKSYEAALRLRQDFALTHYYLGLILEAQGEVDSAIARYRRAVQLKPDLARAWCDLGLALANKKLQVVEGYAALRKGHDLGIQQPGWDLDSASWLAQLRRRLVREARIPHAITQGKPPGEWS